MIPQEERLIMVGQHFKRQSKLPDFTVKDTLLFTEQQGMRSASWSVSFLYRVVRSAALFLKSSQ